MYSGNTQAFHKHSQAHQDSLVHERCDLQFTMLAEPNAAGGILSKMP